jgi:hypothetical protein
MSDEPANPPPTIEPPAPAVQAPAHEPPAASLPPAKQARPRAGARRPYRSWVGRIKRAVQQGLTPTAPAGAEPGSATAAAAHAAPAGPAWTYRPSPEVARVLQLLPVVPIVLALVVALYAQFKLEGLENKLDAPAAGDAVTYYIVAAVLLLVGLYPPWRYWRGAPAARPAQPYVDPVTLLVAWARRNALPLGIGALGTALVLVAGMRANGDPPPTNVFPLFYAWLLGLAGLLVAFLPGDALARLREWAARGRALLRPGAPGQLALVLLVGVIVLAAAVRMIGLETIPVNLGGDEGTQGVYAREFLSVNGQPPINTNMFITGWFSVPTMSFLYNSFGLRLFGDSSVYGLRFPWALMGLLSVVCTFLLVRELWHDNWLALLAAFLLAVNHYHVHFSRLGSVQVADSFFIAAALWLYVRGERTRGIMNFVLCGLLMGLSLYFYFGARVIGLVLGVYGLYRLFTVRGYFSAYRNAVLALGLVAFLTAFPLLRFFEIHPDQFMSRYNQVGIIPSGWLAREVVVTGKTENQLWWDQFRKSIGAFNYTWDPTYWYKPDRPLLDTLTGVAFVLGGALVLWRIRRSSYLLIAAWFGLSLTIGWILTENPPSSMRMVVIAPAVAIIAAVAVWELGRALLRVWPDLLIYAGPLFVVVVAFLNLYFYFMQYTPKAVYGNPTAEVATLLSRDLAQQPDNNYRVYFFGAPAMYFNIGSIQYMVPQAIGQDVTEPLTAPQLPPGYVVDQRALFVFLPQRAGELAFVQQALPDHGAAGCLFDAKHADGSQAFLGFETPCSAPPSPANP